MRDLSKLEPKIRAKYALIRLKNIIKRFPPEVTQNDKVINLMIATSSDIWELNEKTSVNVRDILLIEATCDDLEYLLINVYGESDENHKD